MANRGGALPPLRSRGTIAQRRGRRLRHIRRKLARISAERRERATENLLRVILGDA